MKTNKIQIYSYNIVKMEKGCFMIEYKTSMESDTKILDKKFKSLPKAQEYVMLNFKQLINNYYNVLD